MTDAPAPPPRVLLVEDEPAIRHGLVELLRSQGYQIEVAEDGPGALARLACTTFDLVLLDLMLPGIDGLGVLRQLRGRGPGIPPADRERVFERFFRVARERDAHTPGTGLGLALVRDLARGHGGDALAAGRPGGGAELQVVFPLAPAPGPPA